MKFLHLVLILSLLKLSTLFLKSDLRNCSWITFHSGTLLVSISKAITGSSANWTFSGGFLYYCSSEICLLLTPCTLYRAATSAGSALPRSFSTTTLRSAAAFCFSSSKTAAFSAASLLF